MDDLAPMSATELRDHVETDPLSVREEAGRRLRFDTVLTERAQLLWTVGIAERELGNLDPAAAALRDGIEAAEAAEADQLAGGIRMTLAVVVGRLGHLDQALALLDDAETTVERHERARVEVNRGLILYWRGDFDRAVATLESACRKQRRNGDRTGELRTRVTLGAVLGQLRDVRAADRHLQEAVDVGSELGQTLIVASAHHNLGYLAMLERDLPRAIAEFESAEVGYVSSEAHGYLPQVHLNHAQALADAGLVDDAQALSRRALEMFTADGNEIELAGALVATAQIQLARRDSSSARAAADEAATWYRKQGRDGWVAISTSLALQAAARDDERPVGLAIRLDEVAERLDADRLVAEATRSRLVAALVRAEADSTSLTAEPVGPDTRRRARRSGSVDRMLLAHVDAIWAVRRGHVAAARRAITRGLDIATSQQAVLGSLETRAHAAVHGNALTELGARLAIADRRPTELLARIEATRVMAARMPLIRPPVDAALAELLVELRAAETTASDPAAHAEQRRAAEATRTRIERAVRRRARTARADDTGPVSVQRELSTALERLGDRQLVAHARVDGRLHAVSVVDGHARLHDLGAVDDVVERIEGVTFSLHRLNRSLGSDASRTAAAEMLYVFAEELAEVVLPEIVAESLAPVVVVPTAVLHDVPWGLLPPLAGRSVVVNPSVSAWRHADETLGERRSTLRDGIDAGFVAGPGLDHADLEVEVLAASYTEPVVLSGPTATVAACAELLSAAELAHLACHGSFRRDNPMFSALHLADGPLNVYDLEGMPRLPVAVILSSCSVASAKVLQGGSLLGLANAFTTLGTASVIAPLTPISDSAAVTVMQRVHGHLREGLDPAAALAAATMTHDLADPTAAAFIALGA